MPFRIDVDGRPHRVISIELSNRLRNLQTLQMLVFSGLRYRCTAYHTDDEEEGELGVPYSAVVTAASPRPAKNHLSRLEFQ